MKHSTQIMGMATLALALSAGACEQSAEEKQLEAIEERADQQEEELERAEEAMGETVEGVAEGNAAARGAGEIRQEVEGFKAREEVDDAFDAIEEQHDEQVERAKEAVKAGE